MQDKKQSYEYWRTRILYSTMLGYIFFYFVRKNISMAMPGISEELGITKLQLGAFLTIHGLLYGVSRFTNGIIADRVNPRYFMAVGLMLCAMCSIGFGMSNPAVWIGFRWLFNGVIQGNWDPSQSVSGIFFNVGNVIFLMGVFWVLNGWFQGMGFPPCAKSLSHWFAAEERGVKFSIWNTSHSIGAGFLFLLNGFLIGQFNDWRLCFFVPAVLAIFGSIMLLERLRDTPESMGLPPVEEYYRHKKAKHFDREHQSHLTVDNRNTNSEKDGVFINEQVNDESNKNDEIVLKEIDRKVSEVMAQEPLWQTLRQHVFSNPHVWVIAMANFFVYIVRFSILDWAPTFLKEAKGIEVAHGGVISCCYELVGVFGMICSGLLMDRVFRGRGGKVCFWYMLGCTVTMAIFWWVDSKSPLMNAMFLGILGFFIYGPQCLIGVIAANVATKKAAAAANGLTGILGYASVIVTGWGVAVIAKSQYGWNGVFFCLIGSSFAAMVLFLFVLNAAAPEQFAAEQLEEEKRKELANN